MSDQPTVALVHGAFAESASWNSVIELLQARTVDAIAIANPLRSLAGDATYVRDVVTRIGRPVVLVAHSYGGMVITEAASDHDSVVGLVYVAAFAPDTGVPVRTDAMSASSTPSSCFRPRRSTAG
jgi:pimeloyl-ACP methyl ester carboxylesterase